MKKNDHRRWKKRWIVLDSTTLYCFKHSQDTNPPKTINLFCVSIKLTDHNEHKKFQVITAEKTHEFYAESGNKDIF